MKKGILLIIFLISGFAMAQTTVNLEDQCNCEVLSGTLVTAPGTATPTGADIGDIYVNTNTGTIYFWDGDSWELTSTDSQQLQVFSFNPANNQLTLTLENGGTFNADLSSLTGDGNIISTTINVSGDVNALLGDVVLEIGDDAVTNAKLADDAVQTENILSGGVDQVLVTDAVGTVVWVNRSSFTAIADQITITGVGTVADPFKVEDFSIVTSKLGDDAVTNAKLADDAVQTENILNGTILTEDLASGGNDKVMVTDAIGTVAWVDKSSFDAIADQVTITGLGTTLDPFKVEDLSIVTAKLADGAVTTVKLGDDAVTNAKLADNAVQTENILSGGNDKVLVTDAIGTVAWVDKSSFDAISDQVTITGVGTTADPFKVEDLSIVTAKLADGAVTTVKLGDDAVTNAKLADNAVQTENILSGGNDKVLVTDAVGTVVWVDKSSFAVLADQVTITGVGTVADPFKVEDLSIVTAKLADGAVTTVKLGDDAVTNAKLADNAVQTENILSGGNDKVLVTDAVGTVVWVDKSSFAVLADQVTITGVGTVADPFKVEDLSIVNSKLGPDAVTNAKLADNAVQTENILSGGNDKVLVTDAVGTVAWVDRSSFDAISDQVTITGVGTVADPFKVEDLSIVTAKLADGAVTTVKLADGAVTTVKLGDDAVTNAKLADDAVQTENILSGGNDKVLVTDAVGTVAWVDKSSFDAISDQVTITGVGTTADPFKVEDLSIVTAKLADGAVTTVKLGDDAVTNAKLADNAVQTENILSGGNDKVLVTDAVGTVAWVDKSSFDAISDQVTITGVGTVADPFKVEDLSIVTAKLADGAVTTVKLGDDAVTNAKLADNAVQTENILSGGNDKVLVTDAVGTVAWVDRSSFDAISDQVTITGVGTTADPFKVEDLSIVTAKLADGAVTTVKLGDDAVTNAKLADNAVQTENILSGGNDKVLVTDAVGTVAWVDKSSFDAISDQVTITGVGTTADPFKVEDLSIVTAKLADGAVTTVKLGDDAVTNAKLADNAVQTENILSGGNDKVLVTDAVGTVAWVDKSSFDAISDQVTITGVGTTADPFKVEDLSIVTAKLADGAVTTVKLGDDAVTNAKLADNAVQTENILSGGNDKVLVTDAVGTVAWVDKSSFDAISDQVTITGVGTVADPFKVEDLSIVTAKLGDDAVTNAKLADDAVQTENILSGGNDKVLVTDAVGTVAWVDKSSFDAISDQVTITGVGTTADPFKVEDLSIVTAKLADGAVTTVKLGDDAVTNAKLADNAVQTENILSGGNDKVLVTDAVGTVAWVDKSSFDAISDQVTITGVGTTADPFKVEDLSIVTAKLADGAVTTVKLGDDAVTNAKLADNAVQTENILSGGNDKVLVTDAVG
ncbi:hypothetical protein MWU78_16650, partial [Arenibacter sp. F26102]|nr:hypothetical protein [Arenibacter sp. F26102]